MNLARNVCELLELGKSRLKSMRRRIYFRFNTVVVENIGGRFRPVSIENRSSSDGQILRGDLEAVVGAVVEEKLDLIGCGLVCNFGVDDDGKRFDAERAVV